MTNFEERRRMLGLKCSVLIEDFHYFNNLEFYIKLIENLLFLPKLDPNVTFLSWKIIFKLKREITLIKLVCYKQSNVPYIFLLFNFKERNHNYTTKLIPI